MKIVVCIKQVPGVASVKIDPETKRLIREGVASVLNPFDHYALEEGLRLRDETGGEVIALSMGPKKAADSLREALAFGANRAVLLCDRRFAGSDTWATSYALALAITRLGDVSLVLCGKQAVDGDTAQVGPGIAAHLEWTQACSVTAVEREREGTLRVRRSLDESCDLCRVTLPGVLAVLKEINQPRVPRLTGWLRAMEEPIVEWNADDIGAEEGRLGLHGSPTRVVRTTPAISGRDTSRHFTGPSREAAREIFTTLRQRMAL